MPSPTLLQSWSSSLDPTFNYSDLGLLPMRRRRVGKKASTPPLVECAALEPRTLLTTTVFLDFGFAFPVSGLTVTDAQMKRTDVRGPTKFGTGHTLISLTQTLINQNIDLNADLISDVNDAQILASNITSIVQRTYSPFDVNIQQASADDIGDVATSLAANGTGVGNRDAYVFVAGDDPPANPAFGWAPINTGNTNDNTCFAFADQMIRSLGIGQAATAIARTAAHEAGHTFGLQHTNGSNVLTVGDEMGARITGQPDLRQFGIEHIFSRFPFPLQSGSGTQNNYDKVLSASGLAPNSRAYVTGTGAADRITLTRLNATQTSVLVEAFSSSNFTNLLAQTSYTVPSANGILVDAGASDDTLIVNANVGTSVQYRGMSGIDSLFVRGDGTTNGTYLPDAQTTTVPDGSVSFGGIVTANNATITFSELEANSLVSVQNFAGFAFTSAGGADSITDDTPSLQTTRISGSSSGVTFVPLAYNFVSNMVVDASPGDDIPFGGNDFIVLDAPRAGGLTSLGVSTGEGDDSVRLGIDLADGASHTIGINGGIGFDTLSIDAIGEGQIVSYTPVSSNGGTGSVGSVGLVFAGVDSFVVDALGQSKLIEVNGGTATDDVITQGPITSDDDGLISVNSLLTLNYTGLAAGSTVSLNGRGGDDRLNVTPLMNAGVNANAGDGNGDAVSVQGLSLDYNITATHVIPNNSGGPQAVSFAATETLSFTDGTFTVSDELPATLAVTVGSGASLEGPTSSSSGILGPLTINAGGTLNPGLAATDVRNLELIDVAFRKGSTFIVNLDGPADFSHDILQVTFGVSLGGANLAPSLFQFTPQLGDEIVIIRNAGNDPVVGKFRQGDRVFVKGTAFDINYTGGDGNDVSLIRIDPDDQISEAPNVAIGSTISRTIAPLMDVDMIKFDVAAHQRIGFDVDTPAGSFFDSALRLFDGQGTQLVFNDSGAGPGENTVSTSPFIDYTFDVAGTYYLGLSGSHNNGYNPVTGLDDIAGSIGTCSLTLFDLTPPPDPDDQISEASAIAIGGTANHTITPSTDVDMFSFTVAAGQRIGFDVDLQAGSNLDSYLRIFNGQGSEIAHNDNGAAPGEPASTSSYLEQTFAVGGTYYLGVSAQLNQAYDAKAGTADVAGGSSGGYVLALINRTGASPFAVTKTTIASPTDVIVGEAVVPDVWSQSLV